MSLRIEWEPLSVLLDDGLDDLVACHWGEVAVHKNEMPRAVDWERYHRLEEQKILRIMGARNDFGLIGYSAFFYLPHLHYATTALAANDAIYVYRKNRLGGAGIKMIVKAENDFREEARPGWCRITYHDREGIELLAPVLKKRGYVATDVTYSLMTRAE